MYTLKLALDIMVSYSKGECLDLIYGINLLSYCLDILSKCITNFYLLFILIILLITYPNPHLPAKHPGN